MSFLTAEEEAKFAAFFDWDVDDTAAKIARNHGMTTGEAREMVLTQVRARQEVELSDEFDDITNKEAQNG